MSVYEIEADYHFFYFTTFDTSPVLGPEPLDLLQVVPDGPSLFVFTTVRTGTVSVAVELLDHEPAESLADALAEWQCGEETSIGVTEGLFLCAADPADDVLTEPVVVPSKPGPHTVRVLARGRNEDDYDDVVDVSDEEYQVTFWPTAE